MISAIRSVMQASAPRPVLNAPADDDDLQVGQAVDMALVEQLPDYAVQAIQRGNEAEFGSNERRALATQAATAMRASSAVASQFMTGPQLGQPRGNAAVATGFDRAPAFSDVAGATGLTGAAATYAAMRAR